MEVCESRGGGFDEALTEQSDRWEGQGGEILIDGNFSRRCVDSFASLYPSLLRTLIAFKRMPTARLSTFVVFFGRMRGYE
jgi:hypothetical protein